MNDLVRSPKQLGALLRRARKKQALSQSELAKRTGLRQATISDVENGEGSTRINTIYDILAALDLDFFVGTRRKSDAAELEEMF